MSHPRNLAYQRLTKLTLRLLWSVLTVLLGIAVAGQASRREPGQVVFEQANAAYEKGDDQQAIRLYEKFLRQHPDSISARVNLGAALAHAGRYADAIQQDQGALKRAPGNPGVMLNLALARYKQSDFEKAMQDFARLHRSHPELKQALYLLADCYLRLGRNRDATALLQPAYNADPQDRAVEFALGMALLRDGQTQRAETLIAGALKNGGGAQMDLLVGAAQLTAGEAKIAALEIRKALDADPSLQGGWALLGRAQIENNDAAGARESFHKALLADPNDFEANLYLGGMLRHDGSLAEAAPYLKKALLLRPASDEAGFQVGMIRLAADQLDEARKDFEKVERESPDFQEVHAQLALVYARLSRTADSERERGLVLKLNEKARENMDQK